MVTSSLPTRQSRTRCSRWNSPADAHVLSTGPLRLRLDEPDDVAFGVLELAEREPAHDRLRAHHALAAEALGLRERGLDVRDLHVEGDVAGVARRPSADAAADADPL